MADSSLITLLRIPQADQVPVWKSHFQRPQTWLLLGHILRPQYQILHEGTSAQRRRRSDGGEIKFLDVTCRSTFSAYPITSLSPETPKKGSPGLAPSELAIGVDMHQASSVTIYQPHARLVVPETWGRADMAPIVAASSPVVRPTSVLRPHGLCPISGTVRPQV